jgi:two-component system invasion response regulator UvrY
MHDDLIRVGVVDDHAIVRAALRQLIRDQSDMKFMAEAWDGRSAIDMVRTWPIDVMLLDLQMAGRGGMDVMGLISAKAPEVRVLVLSNLPEEHYALNVIRMGAYGYLNKQCEPEEIVAGIRRVASGQHHISPAVAELMADGVVQGQPSQFIDGLNDREFRLLIHFARGASSSEIADDLLLTAKTVSTYRSVLLRKLGLRTNSDITRYAIKRGLID